jgi:hypothetical protein
LNEMMKIYVPKSIQAKTKITTTTAAAATAK